MIRARRPCFGWRGTTIGSHVNPTLRLAPPSRIAIIGGGPAGSLFALHALQLAARLARPLSITLFERKDLTAAGPRGCNMCAGILSRRVVEGLAILGITLPPEVILGRVRVYQLHWHGHSVSIRPPDASRQVFSVYRAGGPRASPYAPAAGLDEFLIQQAQARGALVIHERVDLVSFDTLPQVHTANRTETFDLVVLASGVNASPPDLQHLEYVHPRTEVMAQDALLVENDRSRAKMESTVHVYFDQPRDLIFGALIPKGHFVTVSLLGRQIARDSLREFLTVPQVTEVVGNRPPQMCGCRPHVAIAPARGVFADRFVAIGDACVTRLYKDGIGSALVTARAAAETALLHGIARDDFATHYEPVCRAIARDNRFGRVVFALVERSKRNALFMRGLARALESESVAAPAERVLSQTLWALFTGDANYAAILRMLFKPRTVGRVGTAILRALVTRDPTEINN